METSPQDAQSALRPSTGMALASLLLGIAAVGLSFLLIGFLLGLVGVIVGIVYLRQKQGPTTMAGWGIGLSSFGILASIACACFYFYFFHIFQNTMAGAVSVPVTGALASPPPLPDGKPQWKSNLLWSVTIPGAQAICVGDWQNDGSATVLVAAGQTLHALDLTGAETSTLPLPDRFTAIECGRNKKSGPRLVGYMPWGRKVSVIDHNGKVLWSPSAGMGLDGAHWGDLDGDGDDALVMGMNGFGGLVVYSSDGKMLWSASMGNVWSQAIVPAASNRPAMVLATDATGSVHVFDKAGNRITSVRPEGGYYAQMAAGVDESNLLQIIGFSGNAVDAFDQTGKSEWITFATSPLGNQRICAVQGALAGDGTRQWVFIDGGGRLVIVTPGGLKLCSIPSQSRIQGFAIAERPGRGGLLLTLDGGVARAYAFEH